MPTTVAAGFTDLLGRLTPTTTESEAAKSHRASIKSCLEANFGTLKAFYRAGSFGNGTSIRGYSDVDYIAALPDGAIPESSPLLLERTRSALQRRFPLSGVFIHSPAIAVPFGTIRDETTEVTPARFEGVNASGHRIFGIAEGSGGWLRASPEAHNEYVRGVDVRLGSRVKALVRLLKAWKFYNEVPVASFYLEMRIAKYCESEASIVYDIDILRFIRFLAGEDLPALQDPMGISGLITPCHPRDKVKVLQCLRRDIPYAEAARTYADSNPRESYRQWNLFFNQKFPAYG